MSNQGFACWYSKAGDLNVANGTVIQPKTGVVVEVGTAGEFSGTVAADDLPGMTAVRSAGGSTFTGGSARNLACTGLTALAGWFTPTIPNTFRLGIFTLTVTGSSAASISDGTDVVATLTTGGTAPVGTYNSTTYGAATYNATASFALTMAAEEGAPGAIPDVRVSISSGTAQGGIYTATDAANYESAVDADWTLFLDPSGEAELRYQGTAVATRASGIGHDPAGRYAAETTAFFYNPQPPKEDDSTGTAATNPFGILTLVYSWPATPDLDTTTRFLSDEVGYPVDGSETAAVYTTFSGDDTGPSGSETVVIDLAQAWLDGAISSVAEVLCHADWYPGAGGSGLATLDISYTVGSYSDTLSICPGGATPAATLVASLRIGADGSVGNQTAAWQAHVQVIGRLPRAGFVYLKVTESAGVLTTVEGPFFKTTLPTSAGSVYYVPLAHCDGTVVKQYHTGALIWP